MNAQTPVPAGEPMKTPKTLRAELVVQVTPESEASEATYTVTVGDDILCHNATKKMAVQTFGSYLDEIAEESHG